MAQALCVTFDIGGKTSESKGTDDLLATESGSRNCRNPLLILAWIDRVAAVETKPA